MVLNDKEQQFLRYLADCFEKGRINMTRDLVCQEQNLSETEYETMIRAMESLGAVENVTGGSGIHATWFEPSFRAVELARDIAAFHEAKRQPDFVEQIRDRMKRNPIVAWIIVVGTLLVLLYPVAVDICERLGWLAAPR